MEIHKLISDVLEGKPSVLSFDDAALGPDKNDTAVVLSALNFARLAFAAVGNTLAVSKTIASLHSRKLVESAFAICREWPSNGVQLGVEDVYRIPLFEVSLKLVSTDYDSASAEYIVKLLENHRAVSSAAILITRFPTIVICLRLQTTARDLFVLFNPRGAERERVASLTFSTSPPQIVQQLCSIFPSDTFEVGRGNLDWQAKLLAKCNGHVFVPRATSHDAMGEESLLVSSLTLLSLRAELMELTQHNGDLKKDRVQLESNVLDLEAQLEEERAKAKRSHSLKSSVAKPIHSTSAAFNRRPQLTQSSRSAGKRREVFDSDDEDPDMAPALRLQEGFDSNTKTHKDFSDSDDEMDPNMAFALQLQEKFDSENEFLLQQKRELMQTAQRQYHCGICLDDVPEDDICRIDGCGHEICRDCTRGHVCAKIEEHRFPVLCPVCTADHKVQNPGTIPSTLVQLLGVSEKQWEIWVEMEIAQFSILFECRKCQHSGFIDRHDVEAESEIHCPFSACDHVWCKMCQQTIDSSGPKHSCDGTSELDHLVKQEGWRYCPSCKTPIQKISGCNHLSCVAPGCNTHFCYGCGETINRTAIPQEIQAGKAAHFQVCRPY